MRQSEGGDPREPSRDELDAALVELIEHYLRAGCPCRFPRFRASVRRSTHGVAGGSFTTWEQTKLVALYAEKVPLLDKRDAPQGWEARCARCGAEALQGSTEFSPGGTIDFLSLKPVAGVEDLGARLDGKLPRASAWLSPGAGMSGMQLASREYPYIGLERWLEWMREPAR